MTNALTELLARFESLPEDQQEELKAEVLDQTKDRRWFPNLGPQTEALFCKADELFYGGEAGGGKSSLLVGTALEDHENSLILRRYNKDARKLADNELLDGILNGNRDGWNSQFLTYREGKKTITFGGCENESDKQRYKGNPNDLIGFDEVSDFLKSQYEFIIGWNRTTNPAQRCRVIAAGNPPTSADGLWVIERWAPWLDPNHPEYPVPDGELRWFLSDETGDDVQVDGPGPHLVGDRETFARSRTFIRASLGDNPDLADDGKYARVLDSLPKELRDAYRDGRFDIGLKDDPFQLIPTAWVRAAQERWTHYPPEGVPMCMLSLDPAQGGADDNVIAYRYDGWYGPLEVTPGVETPLGTSQAGLVVGHRSDECPVIIDCDGGYGGNAYKDLQDNGVRVIAYKGSEGSKLRTEDKTLYFYNRRSEAHWRFREALDPARPGGSMICLPPDNELLQDLTSVRYEVRGAKIKAEPKDKIRERIGRSPGKGDAVVMCWHDGAKTATHYREWSQNRRTARRPTVIRGRR